MLDFGLSPLVIAIFLTFIVGFEYKLNTLKLIEHFGVGIYHSWTYGSGSGWEKGM